MSPHSIDDELKALDKKLKLAELKRLERPQIHSWINPAAIGILLPLVGAFGLWSINELKGYNRAYQALHEVEELKVQQSELMAQKDSLNIELSTLLDLKRHYSGEAVRLEGLVQDFSQEAQRLEKLVQERQKTLDRIYLQAKFAANESVYALKHGGPAAFAIEEQHLEALREAIQELDPELQSLFFDIYNRSEILNDMSSVTQDVLQALLAQIETLSASPEAKNLEWHPQGAFASGRSLMKDADADTSAYYDVELGRFLTASEIAELSN